MERRHFLASLAAAGLLPHTLVTTATAAAQGSQARRPEPLKLGLASYSVRNFKTLEQAIDFAQKLDVKYINFKDFHLPRTLSAEELKAARAKVEAAGLTIMGGGTITFRNDEKQVRSDFEYAKNAGFPLIVGAPSHDAMDLVEKVAKEYKIKVAIHNHGPEDKFFPSPYDVYDAVKKRDPLMGLCIDVGHTVRVKDPAEADPAKAIIDCKDRVYDLHVKDLTDFSTSKSQVIIGKGKIDFPSIFRALLKINFAGHVGMEYEIDADNPLPGMLQSVAYMRGVLAGLAPATS